MNYQTLDKLYNVALASAHNFDSALISIFSELDKIKKDLEKSHWWSFVVGRSNLTIESGAALPF